MRRFWNVSHSVGPDYDVDTAAMYVQHLYMSKVTHKGRVVYPHFTTATDTRNVQIVFRVVMDTIVRENLAAIQMLWRSVWFVYFVILCPMCVL